MQPTTKTLRYLAKMPVQAVAGRTVIDKRRIRRVVMRECRARHSKTLKIDRPDSISNDKTHDSTTS
jgi:hypothetical protein